MKNNKGNMNIIAPAVLIFIIASFVLVLGLQLMSSFGDAANYFDASKVNETGSANNTGYTLALSSTVQGFNSPVIVSVYNGTTLLASGNYTLSGNVLKNASAASYNNLNVSYSYKYGQQASVVSNKSVYNIGTFADYWQIMILAVVVSVVIGLIMLMLPGRKKVN